MQVPDLPTAEGWKAELTLVFVVYRYSLRVRRQSIMPLLSYLRRVLDSSTWRSSTLDVLGLIDGGPIHGLTTRLFRHTSHAAKQLCHDSRSSLFDHRRVTGDF